MATPANRRGDDRDAADRERRRDQGGGSPLAVLLLLGGGLFLLAVMACGGLVVFSQRQAHRREAEVMRAELDARRAEAEARVAEADFRLRARQPERADPRDPQADADGLPPPKPGSDPVADPPPQPAAAGFDAGPTPWLVLFRSKKPDLWNTNTQSAADFALPLRSTPPGTRYLRLRRMDTGAAVIVPMARDRIAKADPAGRPVRWNGEGRNEHGGYHLGLAEGPAARFTEGKGTIGVLMDGWDANPGSGFGHAHHIEDGGQRFSWLGKEIGPTAFEVAVTAADLTDSEKKLLRE